MATLNTSSTVKPLLLECLTNDIEFFDTSAADHTIGCDWKFEPDRTYHHECKISLWISSNSEANALRLLDNLEEVYLHYWQYSVGQMIAENLSSKPSPLKS